MKEGKPILGIIGLAIVILAVIGVVIVAIIHNRPAELTPGTGSFQLMTNGGIAYEWKCESADEKIAKLGEIKTKNLDKGLDGGRIEETHMVEGLKKGTTSIQCNYRSFLEENDQIVDAHEYHVTVDDNLKVNIEEVTDRPDEE